MTGIAFFLSGETADNAAYAYNGTVADGTVKQCIYRMRARCGLSKALLTGQANNRGDLNK